MKLEAIVYFTAPERIDEFLHLETEEEKLRACTPYLGTYDMSSHWTPVGKATVDCTFLPTEQMQQSAIMGIDVQIEQVQKELMKKLNELKARRSELLCLEAPKNVD